MLEKALSILILLLLITLEKTSEFCVVPELFVRLPDMFINPALSDIQKPVLLYVAAWYYGVTFFFIHRNSLESNGDENH